MKKLTKLRGTLIILLAFLMISPITGCSRQKEQSPDQTQGVSGTAGTYEIALITGIGTIDQGINYEAWQGIKDYADANKLSYNYYTSESTTVTKWLDAVENAVDGGAKIIILPGSCFEEVTYKAQDLYPEVSFVLIDGEPHDAKMADYKTATNTTCLLYAEQEAGYLAGYAAVKDGFTNLGFMGGMETPQITRYGYGYLKGADDAAGELGIQITANYAYTNTYNAGDTIKAMADQWYADGTDVIFSCGGSIVQSITEAAGIDVSRGTLLPSGAPKRSTVIKVDTSSNAQSDEVILTAVLKGVRESVEQVLTDYYEGNFPASTTRTITAKDNGVGLTMETSRFEKFTQSDYDAIYSRLSGGSIDIPVDTTAESADQLDLINTTVTVVPGPEIPA